MDNLVSLFVTLIFIVFPTTEYRVSEHNAIPVEHERWSYAGGYVQCSEWGEGGCVGHPIVVVKRGLTLQRAFQMVNLHWQGKLRNATDLVLVTHELLHAYDLMHNGYFDGSPGHPKPEVRPHWATDHCWSNAAEWYVCAALRSGRLH